MNYPCNRCNRDEGSPICLGDERCQRTDRMRAQTLMANGLTEAETAATASVAGLRDPHRGGSSYEASMLRNLLARIHGDGGHYVEQHGLEKALADADDLVAGWRAAQPATAEATPGKLGLSVVCPYCEQGFTALGAA